MTNRVLTYWKLHKTAIGLILLGILGYFYFGHHLERSDFLFLIGIYAVLFLITFKLIQFEKWNFKLLLLAGIVFRVSFLASEPVLSQDYFRFIWDAQAWLSGINPYEHTPIELAAQNTFNTPFAQSLIAGMGELSAQHYSNYPPLNQILFGIAYILAGKSVIGNVVVLRTLIIGADIGTYFFGRKLLKNLNLSPHLIFWYFLNPLIIIELTGNLHFEGVMAFFFIGSLFLLSKGKWLYSAIPYALAVAVKLVPLMFLPIFLKYLGIKRSLPFYLYIAAILVLVTWPFYTPNFLDHYTETVGLWFSNFEFNAGLYNALKYIALQWDAKPWELIEVYGKISAIAVFIAVILITFLRKNQKFPVLISSMFWVLALYFLFSSTVHPWYIAMLVMLAILTPYRSALFWSAVVFLSYSAYMQEPVQESLPLLAVEYFVVIGMMVYELIRIREDKYVISKN